MASLKRPYVTKPLPEKAEIQTRSRRPTKAELRKNPDQKSISESVAVWHDRKGKKRIETVFFTSDGIPRIRVQSGCYVARYRDAQGVVQEVSTGCRDRSAAQAVLTELTGRVELVRAKLMTPEQDRISDHQHTELAAHINDYLTYQEERKRNKDHIQNYRTRLHRSAKECGFRMLADLSADKLEKWLSTQTQFSASVYNGHIEAWTAFGWWLAGKRANGRRSHMQGEKRLLTNPLAGMAKRDPNQDRRRVARALTEDELTKLLQTASERPVIDAETVRRGPNKGKRIIQLSDERLQKLQKLGRERKLIYWTASATGLRKNELRTLAVNDISFGEVPFIRLQHSNEKNKKGSSIPLRRDLATELKAWVEGKESNERVFRVPKDILKILDRDLAAAGIPKVDDRGRIVHLHALRHTFGTNLARAGIAPRVAMQAMRHSNINLTMGVYVDAGLLDIAAAVEKLPVSGTAQTLEEGKKLAADTTADFRN